MHDQAPALIVAHSTVYEPVRKEVKGYVVDPLGKHHFGKRLCRIIKSKPGSATDR